MKAIQVSFDRVRMEEKQNATTDATATKTAVQVPWLVNEFKLIDTPRMADAETKM